MSKYFKDKEFNCKCGCGKNNIDAALVYLLDELRDWLGFPLIINSACRCEKYNLVVGGSPTSSHLIGVAVDIRALHEHTRYLIRKEALALGFERIGTGKTFLHLDIDFTKPQEVEWLY